MCTLSPLSSRGRGQLCQPLNGEHRLQMYTHYFDLFTSPGRGCEQASRGGGDGGGGLGLHIRESESQVPTSGSPANVSVCLTTHLEFLQALLPLADDKPGRWVGNSFPAPAYSSKILYLKDEGD